MHFLCYKKILTIDDCGDPSSLEENVRLDKSRDPPVVEKLHSKVVMPDDFGDNATSILSKHFSAKDSGKSRNK